MPNRSRSARSSIHFRLPTRGRKMPSGTEASTWDELDEVAVDLRLADGALGSGPGSRARCGLQMRRGFAGDAGHRGPVRDDGTPGFAGWVPGPRKLCAAKHQTP